MAKTSNWRLPIVRRAALIGGLLAFGACSPLVDIGGADGPPARIFDIMPQSTNAASLLSLASVPMVILVEEPTSSSILERDRIAVRLGAGEIQYLPNVRFAERPARLIRRSIQASLEDVTGITALGRGALDIPSDYRLKVVVRDFQVNSDGLGREESAVSLQALLISGNGDLIASQTFTERQGLPRPAPEGAIEGLTDGLASTTSSMRAWVLEILGQADS